MQFLSLHVRGFALTSTSAEELNFYYGGFGEVKSVKITATGAALVSFTDRETAKKAKEMSQGAILDGRHLEVAYFEPKEMREIHKLEESDKRECQMKRQRDMYSSNGVLGTID